MAATFTRVPNFRKIQAVSFVGPKGIVRNYKLESGTWTYFIEMPLRLEPDFGRMSAETMKLLTTTDSRHSSHPLA